MVDDWKSLNMQHLCEAIVATGATLLLNQVRRFLLSVTHAYAAAQGAVHDEAELFLLERGVVTVSGIPARAMNALERVTGCGAFDGSLSCQPQSLGVDSVELHCWGELQVPLLVAAYVLHLLTAPHGSTSHSRASASRLARRPRSWRGHHPTAPLILCVCARARDVFCDMLCGTSMYARWRTRYAAAVHCPAAWCPVHTRYGWVLLRLCGD